MCVRVLDRVHMRILFLNPHVKPSVLASDLGALGSIRVARINRKGQT